MTPNEIDRLSQPVQIGFRPRPEGCSESPLSFFDALNRGASLRSSLATYPDTAIEDVRPNKSTDPKESLETWLLEGLPPGAGARLVVVAGLCAAILEVL